MFYTISKASALYRAGAAVWRIPALSGNAFTLWYAAVVDDDDDVR